MKLSDSEIRKLIGYRESGRSGACESPNRPQRRTSYDGDINAKLDEILRRLDKLESEVGNTRATVSNMSDYSRGYDMYTM